MTYENELNTNRRRNISDDIKFTHWIVVIAVAAFTSTGNYPDLPQTITTVIAPTPSS